MYVDIFPIENAPRNTIIRHLKGYIANILRVIAVSCFMYSCRNDLVEQYFASTMAGRLNYKFRLLIGRFFAPIGFQKLYDIFDRFVQLRKDTGICTIPTGRKYYNGECLQKSVFFPVSTAMFEGLVVYVPNDVDRYLANLYGNYMEIPKCTERERHFYIEFQA